MPGDFAGRAILITGGASGIGRETARQVLEAGGKVAIVDRDADTLRSAASFLGTFGTGVEYLQADVTSSEQIEAAFTQAIERVGPLYGVVAAAGIRQKWTAVAEMDEAMWDAVLAVNLKGVFLTCRSAARTLHPGSAIVTVASISGHVARPGQAAYAVSKSGIVQLTRVLALELAERDIRVNAICPGTTLTPMIEAAKQHEGSSTIEDRIRGDLTKFRPGIPLRRVAEPDDQAAAILFFLSARARHITGQALLVDGGESIV